MANMWSKRAYLRFDRAQRGLERDDMELGG